METTGGYEIGLLKYLLNNNIAVHKADMRKVKSFIRSWGKHSKTDKIDAQAIALYAYERHEHLGIYKEHKENQNKLKLLIARRQDLIKILVQEKNCSHAPALKQISKSIKAVITVLEEQID